MVEMILSLEIPIIFPKGKMWNDGEGYIWRPQVCGSPTAEDETSLASCSPPQWGGGELRDSDESQ